MKFPEVLYPSNQKFGFFFSAVLLILVGYYLLHDYPEKPGSKNSIIAIALFLVALLSILRTLFKGDKLLSPKSVFFLIVVLILAPFILFLGNNIAQIEFFSVTFFWFLFIYFTSIFGFFGVLYFIFNNQILPYILCLAYFIFFQFYFINFKYFVLNYVELTFINSFVFICLGFSSLILTYISRWYILRNFLVILFCLNVIFSTSSLFYVFGVSDPKMLQSKAFNYIHSDKERSTFKKYPNIFYIIPDGLASPRILKDYVDIDFETSSRKFQDKGFAVMNYSSSNYNVTYLSLAALFDMSSLITETSEKYKDRSLFYPNIREKKPKLLEYLKSKSYKFIIIPPTWGGCPSDHEYICLTPLGSNAFQNDYAILTLFQNSFLKRIGNILLPNLFGDMDDAGKTAIDHIKESSEKWSDGGVFTMIHMQIPHIPHRKKDCSIIGSNIKIDQKEGYKSSVHCALKRIEDLSDLIIKKFPDATIVVQSDHGVVTDTSFRDTAFSEIPESHIDRVIGNYSSVWGCNSEQAVKLKQANIIRYIVECITGVEVSKNHVNKSYYGFYEGAIDFGKVFSLDETRTK